MSVLIYFGFKWGSEWISDIIVEIIPIEVQDKIGTISLNEMEHKNLYPTHIPLYQQEKIKKLFYQLTGTDSSQVKILFRNAEYPNAMAIPYNRIIILDSLISMSEDTVQYLDVMGVLMHELGHIHYKHSMKVMSKSFLTYLILAYFIGDVSSVSVSLATNLLQLSYSRDYEEQADDYAIQKLIQNKLSTHSYANLLEKLGKLSDANNIPVFLSTHPVTEERVKKIRKASIN